MLPTSLATKSFSLGLSLAVVSAVAIACGGSSPTEGGLQVVTTTAILADFVRNVGGERVGVRSIVPPGADVHTFQSTPGDSVSTSRAKLIVSNGFGLDDSLNTLLKGAMKSSAVHVVAAQGLQSVPLKVVALPSRSSGQQNVVGHKEQRRSDPHFWQNPLFAIHYVERIRDGLIEADPAGAETYRVNAATYIEELRMMDLEIEGTLSAVPPQRRYLVTFHDAFGYFAERYGWEVLAFVPDDAGDVTPASVVEVMELIKEQDIPAVFAEPQFGGDVLKQAAGDAGVEVGVIYSDAVDSTVSTYLEMMRFNTKTLLRHLRQ